MRQSTSEALRTAGYCLKEEAASFLRTRQGKAACGGGIAGWFLGSFTGIAALGTAFNGAWIFAPITGLVMWLGAKRRR